MAICVGSNIWYDQRGYHKVVKRKQYASQCVTMYADQYSSMTAITASQARKHCRRAHDTLPGQCK